MKKIRKILALALAVFMLAGLMPGNVFADGRTTISAITATSNIDSIAQLGHTVQYPTFTITDGSQARFNHGRCFWEKMNGTTWEDYTKATFEEGAYRFQIEIRVDGANGTTHVLDVNGVTVTVDGKAWTCSTPDIDETYSSVWAKSQVFVVRDSSTPLTPHNVNTSVNPADAGTVTATPNSATLGQEVNLTINPNEGYVLDNIKVNESPVSGKSFTMPDAEANVVVNFKKDPSKNTELKAFSARIFGPRFGWADLHFNPAFASSTRNYTASVDKDQNEIYFKTLRAVNEQTVTVKMNGTDVPSFDDTRPTSWTPELLAGANVFEFTVTAKDGTTKDTYKLTVTRGDINDAHNITVVNGKADREKAFEGDYVKVTANDPEVGMVFDRWTSSVSDLYISDFQSSNTKFKMPAENVTLTANYKPDPNTTAYLKNIVVKTVERASSSDWTTQALPGGFKQDKYSYTVDVDASHDLADLYLYFNDPGQSIVVKKASNTITLDKMSSYKKAQDNLANGSNVYTITVTAKDGVKTAIYTVTVNRGTPTVTQYTVSFDANTGTGTMAGATVNDGDSYTLPACTFTPPTGKEFKAWEVGGVEKAVGDSITVNANTTVKATWKEKAPVAHDVNINPATNGTVKADKTKAKKGETVTLTIKANDGYELKEIKVMAGTEEITVTGNTFTMPDKDVSVVVTFKPTGTPPTPTPDPDPYIPPYTPDYYDYYDYYRPHRPYRPYRNEEPEENPEEKPIDKPANKVETDIILVIGSNILDTKINGIDSFTAMDVAPYIKNGRTMLPIRYVAEALGMSVSWDAKTRTVIIQDMFYTVEIPVDTNIIKVNGEVFTSDVKPEIVHGRTMLPIANIARALGLKDGKDILWDAAKKQVTIIRTISR